jgi:hypothetical protein
MDVSLGDIVAVLTLLGGALVWVIHVIISPLKVLLDRVVQSLDKLDETLSKERTRREQIEIRLEAVVRINGMAVGRQFIGGHAVRFQANAATAGGRFSWGTFPPE